MKKIAYFSKNPLLALLLIGFLILCSAFTTVQSTKAGQSVSRGVILVQAVPSSELHSAHSLIRVFATMQQARASIPANTIILGTLWSDANLQGRDLVVYGPSCSNYGLSNLVNYNFNDITSSLLDGCHSVTLYFNTGYSGPQQTYGNGRINYVGNAMNDQASSVLFHS